MEVTMRLSAMDDEGYQIEPAEWNKGVAEELARRENARLTERHWNAIRFMRDCYQKRQSVKHLSEQFLQFPAPQPTRCVSSLPCCFGKNRPATFRPGRPFSRRLRN